MVSRLGVAGYRAAFVVEGVDREKLPTLRPEMFDTARVQWRPHSHGPWLFADVTVSKTDGDRDPVPLMLRAAEQLHVAVPAARAVRVWPDLVTTREIAERAGRSKECTRKWASRRRRCDPAPLFPPPAMFSGRGSGGVTRYLWHWREVRAWLVAHRLLLPSHPYYRWEPLTAEGEARLGYLLASAQQFTAARAAAVS